MYRKSLIVLLCLLCATCFAGMGVTLFASEVSPVSAALDSSAAASVATARLVSSAPASSAEKPASSKPASSAEAVSSRRADADKPADYIPEINDKMQKIPDSMRNKATASVAASSQTTHTASKKAGKASSAVASKKATGSKKASSGKTSSKKHASSKTSSKKNTSSKASSKAQSAASAPSAGAEIVFLSVDGEVREYTALEAVAYNVAAEMDDSYAPEALKAQAVAAHTYIVYSNAQGNAPKLPLRTPSASIRKLVQSVIDKLIYYNGKPINAVYFALSGGDTANAADIWGSDIPYLKSVESKYDAQLSGYRVEKSYSLTDFQSIIAKRCGITLTGAATGWVKILGRTAGDYVGAISLGGKKKATINGRSRTLTGAVLWETILQYGIRSPKFDCAVKGENLVFTTYGYGHCVGLSQSGADEYAKRENRGYKWILKHYYTGVTVK